jgi:hypothetical protein
MTTHVHGAYSSLIVGILVGAAFVYVGTQIKAAERVRPLLIACALTCVFFIGKFWAAPIRELFPSGILAALRYYLNFEPRSHGSGLGMYKYGSILFA